MPQVSKLKFPQSALVTGATSGIGEALCYLLASKGIDLLITGRNAAQLDILQKALGSQVKVIPFQADLSTNEGRQQVIQHIQKHNPDLVVNNAGYGIYGEALEHSTKAQLEMLEVNSNVPLELTLEAARNFLSKKQQGIILNVSSVAAFHFFPYHAVYAASKSCVASFSQALDLELAPKGIRVLTSCPGVVATNFSRRAMQNQKSKMPKGAMTPQFAAEQIWKQIQSGKRCHTFDWRYRLAIFLMHFIPATLLAKIMRSAIQKREQ